MIWGRTWEQDRRRSEEIVARRDARQSERDNTEKMLAAIGKHPWFAWRPVYLQDGRFAWLESVQRRRDRSLYDGHWIWRYEVRP